MLACRARALIRGRLSPSIEDVESLAEPCLAHRMGMRYDPTGEAPGLNSLIDDLVTDLGETMDVRLAGAIVTTLNCVVEQTPDRISVGRVVLRGVDATLRRDTVSATG